MGQDMTTDFGLPGRVAIVTGAARGIGRGVADAYARFGAHVVGCDIDGEELSASMTSLTHAERHLSLQCDLTESAACNRLVDDAMARYGRLDILVNVAGIIDRRDLEAVDDAAWQNTMDANVKSQFFLSRAAARPMKTAGWGRIVNFISQAAHTGGFYGATIYATSKGAGLTLTKSLARQFGPHGITVNAVAPALVDTRMIRDGMSEADIAEVTGGMPTGEMASEADVAFAVMFLTSPSARAITGHTLDINGGLVMR
jgi:NAD(P)-dependent dehydrogenase (short-subunit alcohol dehydrogenase family)